MKAQCVVAMFSTFPPTQPYIQHCRQSAMYKCSVQSRQQNTIYSTAGTVRCSNVQYNPPNKTLYTALQAKCNVPMFSTFPTTQSYKQHCRQICDAAMFSKIPQNNPIYSTAGTVRCSNVQYNPPNTTLFTALQSQGDVAMFSKIPQHNPI